PAPPPNALSIPLGAAPQPIIASSSPGPRASGGPPRALLRPAAPSYSVPCSLSSYLSKDSSDPFPHADLARLLLGATRAFEREMLARLAQTGLEMLAPRHLTVLRGLDAGRGARASAIARGAG